MQLFTHPVGRVLAETYLPENLQRPGPLGLLWWQWLGLPAALLLSYVIGKLLGAITRRILARLARRTATEWDDLLLMRLSAPLTAAWTLAVGYGLVRTLDLADGAQHRVDGVLKTAAVAVFFWAGLRAIDIGFQALTTITAARGNALVRGLLPMLRKAAKIAVFAMAVIAVLTDLGYPVASLLAGLGIGGLAVALAAQKTVENLFGSVSITVDQPCRVGDFVRLESGTAGTVEAIGLRSTRLRTLERTVVTIPNGKLADQRIETFAPRDRCRLSCTLSLVQASTEAQVRAVLAGVEGVLRAHPRIWPEGVSVRFTTISPSSLDVEVGAWFDTADWDQFQAIRQDVLLAFLGVVERAGTALAYPTQTIHLAGKGGASPAP